MKLHRSQRKAIRLLISALSNQLLAWEAAKFHARSEVDRIRNELADLQEKLSRR